MNPVRDLSTGVAAVVAAYFTFELFPVFYGVRFIPFLVIAMWWGMFEAMVIGIQKFARNSD